LRLLPLLHFALSHANEAVRVISAPTNHNT